MKQTGELLARQWQSHFEGRLLTPEDGDYQKSRRIWNDMIDKRPLLIARCVSAADVCAAVNLATSERLPLSVRGGGHGVAGTAVCDNGLMIDLSRMKNVLVDPDRREATAQPGVLWGEFDLATQQHGLATTGGQVSHTGIAGLTLGGGFGYLMGKYGATCDNLLSLDVVTADGELLTASSEQNPDLFWAMRGAGANFGVVTSFRYQVHPVGEVLAGMLLHPRARAAELVAFHREFLAGSPDELDTTIGFLNAPDGTPLVGIIVVYAGDLNEGERLLAPLRSFGPPVADMVARMPYCAVQSMLDNAVPVGHRYYWKSNFVSELHPELVAVLSEGASRMPSPHSMILLFEVKGAIQRVSREAMAFDHRDANFELSIIAQWTDPAHDAANVQWARSVWTEAQPYVSSGVYANHLSADESEDRIISAYGAEKYQKLTTLKSRYILKTSSGRTTTLRRNRSRCEAIAAVTRPTGLGVNAGFLRRSSPRVRSCIILTMDFQLVTSYKPRGDQPRAIEELMGGLGAGEKHQVLLGVTGSGKTFTMAKVIEQSNRPALILAHNKTLAAQLYHEFKQFFPGNAVEYFVSYYDYYQPEAYIPAGDLYIEKESTINEELDKLRLSATRSLFERRDSIIVSSVSCIYGLGSPEAYYGMLLLLEKGQRIARKDITRRLVEILYERNDVDFRRGTFRVRGDVIEVFPTYDESAYRIELFGDEIESLAQIDPLFGTVKQKYSRLPIYPKSHYVVQPERKAQAIDSILKELEEWTAVLESQGRMVEAQRIQQRTRFDLEMIKSMGYCHGIENYSRHFSGRLPGEAPPTLLDYFPRDFLLFVDESHATIPQVHGMWHGDRSRKQNLVDYGFRLPSAVDNRPLKFEEFETRVHQAIYVSATPGPYELTRSAGVVVEQVIRPTGLVDPQVEIRPVKGQIDDLLAEIRDRANRNERVLVTTLTKRMSEDLAGYYTEVGVRCRYMHSEIETLERVKLLAGLRKGEFDVLIGINLLREGLDLPEVSLVAILDADKEGFLRSSGSLIQTMGRAARHIEGRAILYADNMTDSMRRALDETNRRREIQSAYNEEHGITPQSVISSMDMGLAQILRADYRDLVEEEATGIPEFASQADVDQYIGKLETEMRDAAKKFEFEKAARLRDTIKDLRSKEFLFT